MPCRGHFFRPNTASRRNWAKVASPAPSRRRSSPRRLGLPGSPCGRRKGFCLLFFALMVLQGRRDFARKQSRASFWLIHGDGFACAIDCARFKARSIRRSLARHLRYSSRESRKDFLAACFRWRIQSQCSGKSGHNFIWRVIGSLKLASSDDSRASSRYRTQSSIVSPERNVRP